MGPKKQLAAACLALPLLAACGSTPAPQPTPKAAPQPVDPIITAIATRYGACLKKLGITQPYDANIYRATHKADVSNGTTVISFRTATSNTGKILTIPDDSDKSAQALTSVGC